MYSSTRKYRVLSPQNRKINCEINSDSNIFSVKISNKSQYIAGYNM